MYLPFVLQTGLLDLAKQRLQTSCYCTVELIHQTVLNDDFANLNNWTEVDSGTNVNLSSGVVSINGNGSWGQNGIYLNTGMTRAVGYFEVKVKWPVVSTEYCSLGIGNVQGLNGNYIDNNFFLLTKFGVFGTPLYIYTGPNQIALSDPGMQNDTWYTFRFYVGKSYGTTNWRKAELTIQGSQYALESRLVISDVSQITFASPIYFAIQRFGNIGTGPLQVKEFRWNSGYATDAPPVKFVADAGSGSTWENFDLSSLAFPAGFSNANATFKWAFHDDATFATRTMSNALTLTQLNAVGKQSSRHRYAEIWVLQNSDGSTQSLATEINAATATDSGGGAYTLPSAGNVWSGAPDYGLVASPTTPTRVEPTEAQVQEDVVYGDPSSPKTGTFSGGADVTLPIAGNVWSGASQYGFAGNLITPTRIDPLERNVLKNIQYGNPSSLKTGTLQVGNADPSLIPTTATALTKLRLAFRNHLLTIRTINGYRKNMEDVYDPPKSFEQMTRFPCANLLWGNETVEGAGDGFGGRVAGNDPLLTNRLPVTISIAVNAANFPLEQDRIMADVQQLLGNEWWIPDENGVHTAFDCVYTGCARYGTDLASPNAVIDLYFDIRYRLKQKDPNTIN